eukprot:TRINITY_DN18108_c1_g1_i1.p3 TRINITY_DN18108_c1_g1~~TRINITY_DN18108_c1_g1_i1.p3  ORF type:complete len:121 (+),score=2.01 TRINITY_DN18108_c1_g1_i1:70-432(+)
MLQQDTQIHSLRIFNAAPIYTTHTTTFNNKYWDNTFNTRSPLKTSRLRFNLIKYKLCIAIKTITSSLHQSQKKPLVQKAITKHPILARYFNIQQKTFDYENKIVTNIILISWISYLQNQS